MKKKCKIVSFKFYVEKQHWTQLTSHQLKKIKIQCILELINASFIFFQFPFLKKNK